MSELIIIEGSYGEGGGQIIRTSLSLSAITGRPVEIVNIRAGRDKPGLKAQHLASVRASAVLCAAHLEGDAVGFMRLRFAPTCGSRAGDYRFDIGTAGATSLVAQTILLPLVRATGGSHVVITGGTHVPWAPTLDYLQHVYIPALRSTGIDASVSYSVAGFFPKGGGEVELRVGGSTAVSLVDMVERGKLLSLRAYIVTSNLPDHVADRGAATVLQYMKAIGRPVEVDTRSAPSSGTGAAITLVAECEGGIAGFCSLGERGKPMEIVVRKACDEFLDWWKSGAAVEAHLADQLVLPAVLACGECRWTTPSVTEHLRTVLWLAAQFLPVRSSIEAQPNGCSLVRVNPE